MDTNGPRQYRSRRNRPCDLCRVRKVGCKIDTHPPCRLCSSKGQQCTFNKASGPRKRRRIEADDAMNEPTAVPAGLGEEGDQYLEEFPQVGANAELEALFQFFGNDYSLPQPSPSAGFAGDDGDRQVVSQFSQAPVLLPRAASTPSESEIGNRPPESGQDGDWTVGQGQNGQEEDERDEEGEDEDEEMYIGHESRGDAFSPYSSEPDNPSSPTGDSVRGTLSNLAVGYVGPSGDLDPFLLAHRTYGTDHRSTSQYTNVVYYRMRPLGTGPYRPLPPAVFTSSQEGEKKNGTTATIGGTRHLRDNFRDMLDEITASGLVALFMRFVYPYMPIISRQQLPTRDECALEVPLCLLSAICATAIPFVLYDDALCVEVSRLPTPSELFQFSWRVLNEEGSNPSLPALQARLLLLQYHRDRKAAWADADVWSNCSQMVATAQSLGLHDDPSHWSALPRWERKLRKRLWWVVWTVEKWIAFGQGMSSHLHKETFNVRPLTQSDLMDSEVHDRDVCSYFLSLVQLTHILDDIVGSFFTMRAASQTAGNIPGSLQAAKLLRQRLKEWHHNLPSELRQSWYKDRDRAMHPVSSKHELDGNASLWVAFFTAQLAIFRALLRPISMQSLPSAQPNSDTEGNSLTSNPQFTSAVIRGALSGLRDLVNFVEQLTTVEWDAFWPEWSRHNFALASTLLMHCYLITAPPKGGDGDQQPPAPLLQMSSPQSELSADSQQLQDELERITHGVFPLRSAAIHTEIRLLAQKWRWLLRLAARGAASKKSLIDTSLLRINALFTEWNRQHIRNAGHA
ncbi:hypothetical protein GQ53DRAFT_746115 [Thozetella sp. PMI_491]|nr:hypothetical protein GQ53DRAFT_746115 [Thozetella sp. PMI_491]